MDYLLKEIISFVRIIELGSFKAAAGELHLTQSALTQRLKKLEEAIGARLIERTTRRVTATAVGRSFLPTAKRMLGQFDDAMSDLHDVIHARAGRVTIASLISTATYILPAAIQRFSADHPDVSVRVLDDSERDIADYVRRGEAEFAIDMHTSVPDPDLVITPLMEDHFVLACRADHPLANHNVNDSASSGAINDAITWDALAGLPVVMLGPRSGTSRLLLSHLAGARRSPAWRYEVQHLSTMLGFIDAGLGVGIVPGMAMRSHAAQHLVQRPLAEPDLARTVVLVERRGAELSPAAQRLKTLLLTEFETFSKTACPNMAPH